MQVSNTILIVAAEIYAVLLITAILLFVYTRRLKSLLKHQQEKLIALLREPKDNKKNASLLVPTSKTVPPVNPPKSYKNFLNEVLDATSQQYELISPEGSIGTEQTKDASLFQRILAVRYAFLRAEELGTTEPIGSAEYWDIFQQALEPLLGSGESNQGLENEIEVCKKRIANLEKFKLLFFDMEKQWSSAQANAENYYKQLNAKSEELTNKQGFQDLLQQYHGVYNEVSQSFLDAADDANSSSNQKTILITRQDPRAAEEIVKLRNVAADQHRTINQLQRKLAEASNPTEKEAVFQELEQQLQRQIRFVQESEVCVQLLEEELEHVQAELTSKEKLLSAQTDLKEENQRIKDTLQNFSLESKDLVKSLAELEKMNEALKRNAASSPAPSQTTAQPVELKRIQTELTDLQKQYADLEEKYLNLKLKN